MDLNSIFIQGGITTVIMAVVGILYKVFNTINNKRVVSHCCGKELSADFKVSEISPSVRNITVKVDDAQREHTEKTGNEKV